MCRGIIAFLTVIVSTGINPVCIAGPASAPPTETAISEDGIVATLYTPPDVSGRLPGVITLGGSGGGLDEPTARYSRLIAQRGYLVLQLAYFDAPGLPKDLELIPLEYFDTAINWLRAQPHVDPGRIGIVGGSIGGETALTVASHYPQIKVVIATMPSSVVWPGIVHHPGEPASTYTLGGKPLPYLPYGGPFTTIYGLYAKGLLALDQHQDAIIPVEDINGPVMLVCGKSDTLWPSCPMSEQVAARLKAKHFGHRVALLEYADAGHAVFGKPHDPHSPGIDKLAELGGTPQGNNAARADSLPKALKFLDAALKH